MQGKTNGFFKNPSLNRRYLKSTSVHNSLKQKNTPAQKPTKPGGTICSCMNLLYWSQKCVCFEECSQAWEHGSLLFPSCLSQHLSSPQNRLSCTPSPQTTAFSYRRADMKCRCSCYLKSNQSIGTLKRPVKLSVDLNKGHTVVWCGLFLLQHLFEYIFLADVRLLEARNSLLLGLVWHGTPHWPICVITPGRSISSLLQRICSYKYRL